MSNKIIFLDGGTGTALSSRGIDSSPLVNLSNPGSVKEIHSEFIKAGADIIETNTFTANPLNYSNYRRLIGEGVKIARRAAAESSNKPVKIAGSIGPTGKMVAPLGKIDFEDAVLIFKKTASALKEAGAHLIIIETMDDIAEMRAALIGAREAWPQVEIIATMTFSPDGRTSTGTPAPAAAAVMEALGASVIGLNCSSGPEGMKGPLSEMRKATSLPLIAQPNAGLPEISGGRSIYPEKPLTYARKCSELVKAGASYIGGCCGAGPGHITELRKKLENCSPPHPPVKSPLIISSRTSFLRIGEYPCIIGERINFTARPRLKSSSSLVVAEALKQKKGGAAALDINMGGNEEDTLKTVMKVEEKSGMPLVLDSQNPEEVEKAARRYPGVLLLNSVSGEKEKMDSLLPVVKKYGIPFIALSVNDRGVPRRASQKIKTAEKIISRAEEMSINTSKILVDPVVLTLSSDPLSASRTLKALKKMDRKSVLGVSNVSSGLPRRALLNQTLVSLSVYCGVSALIADPLDRDLVDILYSSALVSGRDTNALKYSSYFSPDKKEIKFKNPLSKSIFEGNTDDSPSLAREILKTESPLALIEKIIAPALEKVGEEYGKRSIFLPQLIEAARSAEKAIDEAEKKLKSQGKLKKIKGTVVIATVKGDIHDIGKNLVTLLLKNSSFNVIDLGVDVPSEKIVEEAISRQADIVALSSLMTTTMPAMKEVKKILKKRKKSIPLLVGGAAVTLSFSSSIGASYAPDAVKAVRAAEKIIRG